MPYNWNTEARMRLLLAVFQKTKPKCTMDLYRKLADEMGEGVTAKAVELQLGKLRKNGESPSASPKKSNTIKSESFGPDESAKIDASTPKRFSSRKRPLKSYAELSDSDSEDDVVPEIPTKIKKIEKAVKLEGDISRSPDSLTPDEQWHI